MYGGGHIPYCNYTSLSLCLLFAVYLTPSSTGWKSLEECIFFFSPLKETHSGFFSIALVFKSVFWAHSDTVCRPGIDMRPEWSKSY